MADVDVPVTLGLGPGLVQRIREVDSRLGVSVLGEPLSPESELWRLHNVIISPHIAGETPTTTSER